MKKLMVLLMLASSFILFIACGNTTESTTQSTTTTQPTTEEPTTEVTTVTTQTTTTESNETAELSVSSSKPYIFVDVNESVNLQDYSFRTLNGEITLDEANVSNISEGLTIESSILSVSSEGKYTFDISYNDTVLKVYVFAKLAEATDYLIYTVDFSDYPNGDLPSDYSIENIGLGTTGIKDGYLFVDSPDIGDPTRVLLPSFLSGFKNYIIEVDFTILSAVENSRWASLMYRFSTDNYFQMCVRQNAVATNGVEFAKAVNGQWNVPMTASFTEMINPASIYRMKVDLFNSNVKEYIDDQLLIEYDYARDYSNGHIGVQASGARAIFNNFEIRVPETYIDYSSIEYQTLADVYTPETNLLMAPTVVQTIETQDDIDSLSTEVRPATALFDINPNLEAVNDDNEVLMSMIDILEVTKVNTIPAFRTDVGFVGSILAIKLEELGVRDSFVISSNPTVLKVATSRYSLIRGVLEILYDEEKPVLTDDDLLAIRNDTNSSSALAVMLPIEYATRYNVDYLQRRLVTVWVDTHGLEDYDVIQGVVSGANGLVTDNYKNVYTIFDRFPENAMMRLPLIIGHRGMPSVGPENTVEGSVLAYEAGADIVELDIYLSADNEIIVMHDDKTERTTDGNLVVEE